MVFFFPVYTWQIEKLYLESKKSVFLSADLYDPHDLCDVSD